MKSGSGLEAEQIGPKQMRPCKWEPQGIGVNNKTFAYVRSFEKIQF